MITTILTALGLVATLLLTYLLLIARQEVTDLRDDVTRLQRALDAHTAQPWREWGDA